MKKLIIITFILSFLTTSIWSETLSLEDLVKRDDIYYQKFSNIPYSGKIIGTKTGKIENGIMVGEWLSYFKSGQLEFIHNYKMDKEMVLGKGIMKTDRSLKKVILKMEE